MPKIFLIGYMGSGKTTIGKSLAKKMNLSFIDVDLFIENRFRKSINQIFEEKGEDVFREMERKALEEILDFEDVVISTGGGLPCFFNNMERMNEKGITVYLEASPENLAKRLNAGKQKRPLIKDKNDQELICFIEINLEKRRNYYEKSLYKIDTEELVTDKDVEEKVSNLMACLSHNAAL